MATDKEKVLAFLRTVSPSKGESSRPASNTASGAIRPLTFGLAEVRRAQQKARGIPESGSGKGNEF